MKNSNSKALLGEMLQGSPAISVEVAYAMPEKQKIIALQVAAGSTAYDAALQSGISQLFPQIDLENDKMGVFGNVVKAKKYVLNEGQRVEIYRPLSIDPKQARKARAANVKAKNVTGLTEG